MSSIERHDVLRTEVQPTTVESGPNTRDLTELIDYLIELAGELQTSADAPPVISADQALSLDSLGGVELKAVIEAGTGLDVPLADLLECRTVSDIADLVQVVAEQTGEVDQRQSGVLPAVVVDPARRHEPFGLTDLQQAYLLGRQNFYEMGNVPASFYFEVDVVDVDLGGLERAFGRVVARHDMLRAVVLADGRQQVLVDVPDYEIAVSDLRGLSESKRERVLSATRERLASQVLPTDAWPLFDIRAHRVDDRRTRLHVTFDLLIVDATSLKTIVAEWAAHYANPNVLLPEPVLSFRDYVVGVEGLVDSAAFKRARDYWMDRIEELPSAPDLPLAVAPGSIERPEFSRRGYRMDRERWARLRERATAAGVSPSMLLCAAYAEVLGCWSAGPRFSVNVTVSGRLPVHPEVGQVLGDFTSLVLLACGGGESSFRERARVLQRQFWSDFDHRVFSGVRVLRELARMGGPSRGSMPVVFTSVLGDELSESALPEWFEDFPFSVAQVPQVHLENQVFEIGGQLVVNWDAVEDLYPAGLLDSMFDAYVHLVERLADDDTAWDDPALSLVPLADLAVQDAANATDRDLPGGLLHELLDRSFAHGADRVAVIDGDRCLTYAELDERANRVAHCLRERGVTPNSLVGVVMDKGWAQVVAVVGVCRAGGAYLPVDAALPAQRIAGLLADGDARIVLTQTTADERVRWPADVVRLRVDDDACWARYGVDRPAVFVSDLDLAYVIFTSGSTGRPKGVMIDHRGAVNTVVDINQRFQIGPDDRVLALSSLSFDLSVWDIFGVLAAGGAVVLPRTGHGRDPEHWADLVVAHRVTVWNSVPALMQMLVEHAGGRTQPWADCLRLVMMSGDWIPVSLPGRLRALADPVEIISLGGATEASIWSILYPVGEVDPDWPSIPYGTPLSNQGFHVLDRDGCPRPVWVPGDLHISGIGVAQGYWGDAERTAASFSLTPDGERLYRTGDLGRYLPDGTIEFLGRDDTQVKINGYRIELGEIEATLAHHPAVVNVVVTTRNQQLHAYLTPAPNADDLLTDVEGQVRTWELVFDEIRGGDAEGVSEFAGWNSSHTGAPLPVEHMTEWAEATVERIRRLGARTILEIGCGAGILLRRLLPDCDRYLGTDISARTLADLREMLPDEQAGKVELLRVDAADVAERVFGEGDAPMVDVVVINSVAQYFPDAAYLVRVIESVIPHVRPGGAVFVGDVHGVTTLPLFASSIELHRSADDSPADAARAGAAARVESDPELAVDPELFHAVARTSDHVARVHIAPRDARLDNEMARYRFDAVLHIGPQPEALPVEHWATADRDLDRAALAALFAAATVESFGLRAVPNAWLTADRAVLDLLESGTGTASTIREAGVANSRGLTPAQVWSTAEEHGWTADISWAHTYDDGAYDVVFRKDDRVGWHEFPVGRVAVDPTEHANDPRRNRTRTMLEQTARDWLGDRLPAYMLPATYTVLDRIPLTGNGKVDRAALPAPAAAAAATTAYVAPRNETEFVLADLFGQVLGVSRVSTSTGFFELGGDSVAAVRFVAAAADSGIDLSLADFFADPTVAAVAARVADRGTDPATPAMPEITPDPAARFEPFGLTDLQQAYLLGRNGFFELNSSTNFYAEVDVLDVDLARLEAALGGVIARHDMLRAVFLADGRQQVSPETPAYRIVVDDLTSMDAPSREAALLAARDRLSRQVLPTDTLPLFDIRAHRLDNRRTRLHVTVDLLIFDGTSLGLFITELFSRYTRPDLELPPLDLTYRDYVLGVDAMTGTTAFERARDYWMDRVDDLPPAPELPLAQAPSAIAEARFTRREHRLDARRWGRLRERAANAGVSPSMLLCAAYAEVLSCWSAAPRFSINVTVSGRLPIHAEVGQVIGDFTSLVLLSRDADGKNFRERVGVLQRQFWSDFDHRLFSGVRVLRELARVGGPSRGSMPVVFTSVLGDLNLDAAAQVGDLVHTSVHTPQVYLDHQVFEIGGELVLNWDAVDELFPAGLLDSMYAAYVDLVESLADDGTAWDGPDLDLVPAADLLVQDAANATDRDLPGGLLHELLDRSFTEHADKVAVIDGDRCLTYAELDRRANRVAHRLLAGGVAPNCLVGVVMDKGWAQVVAVVGVCRAGGAYLPVDASLPAQRIAGLLADGGARIVLTQTAADERVDWPDGVERFRVDADAEWADRADDRPTVAISDLDLAYVIFTSGSTGRPKGVMIDHRGAVNTVVDINQRFEIGPDDRVLALSSLSFDLSVWDVFGVLAAGGAVVLPQAGHSRDPEHWADLVAAHRVTVWNSVPALLQMLVEHNAEEAPRWGTHLRLVMMSGDWIPVSLPGRLRALADPVEIISLGGATEASIWSIFYPIGEVDPDWPSIPYGTPLSNQRFHVLDRDGRSRPVWATGDLHISGIGVAQGYWGAAERTAASFSLTADGERLYRTGDLGRYRPDGTIEFLGRDDTQVKINGYRIELGEIEATLAEHPTIANAVVTTRDQQLHAYAVPGDDGIDLTDVDAYLRDRLPVYMIPSRYALIDDIPLTGNGKVCRASLPELGCTADRDIAAPVTDLELLLHDVWREVLGVDTVGVTERFTELGGDSLLGLQVIAKAGAAGWRITPQQFFARPTIRALAEVATPVEVVDSRPDDVGPVPLSPMQRTFLSQDIQEPGHWNYAFLFEVGAPLDPSALRAAVTAVVAHHDGLRTGFSRVDSVWTAAIAPRSSAAEVPVDVVELSGLAAEDRAGAIEQISADRQRLFDLAAGPLVRVVYFDCGAEQRHRLLVIGHWLVWDNYSTRVFFDDLMSAYGQILSGLPVALPPVSTPVAAWLRVLDEHSARGLPADEAEHWARHTPPALDLPADLPGPNSLDSAATIVEALDIGRTAALLDYAADTETSVADVLLTALARAVADWTGWDRVAVDMEAHGREGIDETADLSRTVGRLSARYPLVVDLADVPDVQSALARVAKARAEVPRGGVGYGLVREHAERGSGARICFNYLGRMDGMFRDDAFAPAPEFPGAQHSSTGTRAHALDLLSAVVDGELVVGVTYSAAVHTHKTVAALTERLLDRVAALVPDRYRSPVAIPAEPGRRSVSSVLRSWMDSAGGER